MVIFLILLNNLVVAAYKHVFNTVCVVILFSSMWSYNLRSEVKTSPRYFTLRTISVDFPSTSIASCLHSFELKINALVFQQLITTCH